MKKKRAMKKALRDAKKKKHLSSLSPTALGELNIANEKLDIAREEVQKSHDDLDSVKVKIERRKSDIDIASTAAIAEFRKHAGSGESLQASVLETSKEAKDNFEKGLDSDPDADNKRLGLENDLDTSTQALDTKKQSVESIIAEADSNMRDRMLQLVGHEKLNAETKQDKGGQLLETVRKMEAADKAMREPGISDADFKAAKDRLEAAQNEYTSVINEIVELSKDQLRIEAAAAGDPSALADVIHNEQARQNKRAASDNLRAASAAYNANPSAANDVALRNAQDAMRTTTSDFESVIGKNKDAVEATTLEIQNLQNDISEKQLAIDRLDGIQKRASDMINAIKDVNAYSQDSVYTKSDGTTYSIDPRDLDKISTNLEAARTAMADGDNERALKLLNDIISDPAAPTLDDDLKMQKTDVKLKFNDMIDLVSRTDQPNKMGERLMNLMQTIEGAKQQLGHAIRQQRIVDIANEKASLSKKELREFLVNDVAKAKFKIPGLYDSIKELRLKQQSLDKLYAKKFFEENNIEQKRKRYRKSEVDLSSIAEKHRIFGETDQIRSEIRDILKNSVPEPLRTPNMLSSLEVAICKAYGECARRRRLTGRRLTKACVKAQDDYDKLTDKIEQEKMKAEADFESSKRGDDEIANRLAEKGQQIDDRIKKGKKMRGSNAKKISLFAKSLRHNLLEKRKKAKFGNSLSGAKKSTAMKLIETQSKLRTKERDIRLTLPNSNKQIRLAGEINKLKKDIETLKYSSDQLDTRVQKSDAGRKTTKKQRKSMSPSIFTSHLERRSTYVDPTKVTAIVHAVVFNAEKLSSTTESGRRLSIMSEAKKQKLANQQVKEAKKRKYQFASSMANINRRLNELGQNHGNILENIHEAKTLGWITVDQMNSFLYQAQTSMTEQARKIRDQTRETMIQIQKDIDALESAIERNQKDIETTQKSIEKESAKDLSTSDLKTLNNAEKRKLRTQDSMDYNKNLLEQKRREMKVQVKNHVEALNTVERQANSESFMEFVLVGQDAPIDDSERAQRELDMHRQDDMEQQLANDAEKFKSDLSSSFDNLDTSLFLTKKSDGKSKLASDKDRLKGINHEIDKIPKTAKKQKQKLDRAIKHATSPGRFRAKSYAQRAKQYRADAHAAMIAAEEELQKLKSKETDNVQESIKQGLAEASATMIAYKNPKFKAQEKEKFTEQLTKENEDLGKEIERLELEENKPASDEKQLGENLKKLDTDLNNNHKEMLEAQKQAEISDAALNVRQKPLDPKLNRDEFLGFDINNKDQIIPEAAKTEVKNTLNDEYKRLEELKKGTSTSETWKIEEQQVKILNDIKKIGERTFSVADFNKLSQANTVRQEIEKSVNSKLGQLDGLADVNVDSLSITKCEAILFGNNVPKYFASGVYSQSDVDKLRQAVKDAIEIRADPTGNTASKVMGERAVGRDSLKEAKDKRDDLNTAKASKESDLKKVKEYNSNLNSLRVRKKNIPIDTEATPARKRWLQVRLDYQFEKKFDDDKLTAETKHKQIEARYKGESQLDEWGVQPGKEREVAEQFLEIKQDWSDASDELRKIDDKIKMAKQDLSKSDLSIDKVLKVRKRVEELQQEKDKQSDLVDQKFKDLNDFDLEGKMNAAEKEQRLSDVEQRESQGERSKSEFAKMIAEENGIDLNALVQKKADEAAKKVDVIKNLEEASKAELIKKKKEFARLTRRHASGEKTTALTNEMTALKDEIKNLQQNIKEYSEENSRLKQEAYVLEKERPKLMENIENLLVAQENERVNAKKVRIQQQVESYDGRIDTPTSTDDLKRYFQDRARKSLAGGGRELELRAKFEMKFENQLIQTSLMTALHQTRIDSDKVVMSTQELAKATQERDAYRSTLHDITTNIKLGPKELRDPNKKLPDYPGYRPDKNAPYYRRMAVDYERHENTIKNMDNTNGAIADAQEAYNAAKELSERFDNGDFSLVDIELHLARKVKRSENSGEITQTDVEQSQKTFDEKKKQYADAKLELQRAKNFALRQRALNQMLQPVDVRTRQAEVDAKNKFTRAVSDVKDMMTFGRPDDPTTFENTLDRLRKASSNMDQKAVSTAYRRAADKLLENVPSLSEDTDEARKIFKDTFEQVDSNLAAAQKQYDDANAKFSKQHYEKLKRDVLRAYVASVDATDAESQSAAKTKVFKAMTELNKHVHLRPMELNKIHLDNLIIDLDGMSEAEAFEEFEKRLNSNDEFVDNKQKEIMKKEKETLKATNNEEGDRLEKAKKDLDSAINKRISQLDAKVNQAEKSTNEADADLKDKKNRVGKISIVNADTGEGQDVEIREEMRKALGVPSEGELNDMKNELNQEKADVKNEIDTQTEQNKRNDENLRIIKKAQKDIDKQKKALDAQERVRRKEIKRLSKELAKLDKLLQKSTRSGSSVNDGPIVDRIRVIFQDKSMTPSEALGKITDTDANTAMKSITNEVFLKADEDDKRKRRNIQDAIDKIGTQATEKCLLNNNVLVNDWDVGQKFLDQLAIDETRRQHENNKKNDVHPDGKEFSKHVDSDTGKVKAPMSPTEQRKKTLQMIKKRQETEKLREKKRKLESLSRLSKPVVINTYNYVFAKRIKVVPGGLVDRLNKDSTYDVQNSGTDSAGTRLVNVDGRHFLGHETYSRRQILERLRAIKLKKQTDPGYVIMPDEKNMVADMLETLALGDSDTGPNRLCSRGSTCGTKTRVADDFLYGDGTGMYLETGDSEKQKGLQKVMEEYNMVIELEKSPELQKYVEQKAVEAAAEQGQRDLDNKIRESADRRQRMAEAAGADVDDLTINDLETTKILAESAYNEELNRVRDEKMNLETEIAQEKDLLDERDRIKKDDADLRAELDELNRKQKELDIEKQELDSWMDNTDGIDLDEASRLTEASDAKQAEINAIRLRIAIDLDQLNADKATLAEDTDKLAKIDADQERLNEINNELDDLDKKQKQAADDVAFEKNYQNEIEKLENDLIKKDENGKFSKQDIDKVNSETSTYEGFEKSIQNEVASVDEQIVAAETEEKELKNEIIESVERREAQKAQEKYSTDVYDRTVDNERARNKVLEGFPSSMNDGLDSNSMKKSRRNSAKSNKRLGKYSPENDLPEKKSDRTKETIEQAGKAKKREVRVRSLANKLKNDAAERKRKKSSVIQRVRKAKSAWSRAYNADPHPKPNSDPKVTTSVKFRKGLTTPSEYFNNGIQTTVGENPCESIHPTLKPEEMCVVIPFFNNGLSRRTYEDVGWGRCENTEDYVYAGLKSRNKDISDDKSMLSAGIDDLYEEDRVMECMQRCRMEHPTAHKFFLKHENEDDEKYEKCACVTGDCSNLIDTGLWDYYTYSIPERRTMTKGVKTFKCPDGTTRYPQQYEFHYVPYHEEIMEVKISESKSKRILAWDDFWVEVLQRKFCIGCDCEIGQGWKQDYLASSGRRLAAVSKVAPFRLNKRLLARHLEETDGSASLNPYNNASAGYPEPGEVGTVYPGQYLKHMAHVTRSGVCQWEIVDCPDGTFNTEATQVMDGYMAECRKHTCPHGKYPTNNDTKTKATECADCGYYEYKEGLNFNPCIPKKTCGMDRRWIRGQNGTEGSCEPCKPGSSLDPEKTHKIDENILWWKSDGEIQHYIEECSPMKTCVAGQYLHPINSEGVSTLYTDPLVDETCLDPTISCGLSKETQYADPYDKTEFTIKDWYTIMMNSTTVTECKKQCREQTNQEKNCHLVTDYYTAKDCDVSYDDGENFGHYAVNCQAGAESLTKALYYRQDVGRFNCDKCYKCVDNQRDDNQRDDNQRDDNQRDVHLSKS
jgi:hypothetical protein